MGFDYALVHLRYTIPPAVALTLIYRPFLSRLDLYKIAWLSCFAVTAAIPWDAYQIYRGIWTYPPDAIVGPTLFGIPSEELFFFVIQTYTTSLLYLLLTKPVLHSAYITRDEVEKAKDPQTKWLVRPRVWATGQMIPGLLSLMGAVMVYDGGRGTYLGLILIWVGPIILLLWYSQSRRSACERVEAYVIVEGIFRMVLS
ncbi:MAG: hypothetical protein M1816_000824 [Peltula sp. TS41687]|nr:MAG: hypothetical protein M1816_000824 [Peltula sp. TS41687]